MTRAPARAARTVGLALLALAAACRAPEPGLPERVAGARRALDEGHAERAVELLHARAGSDAAALALLAEAYAALPGNEAAAADDLAAGATSADAGLVLLAVRAASAADRLDEAERWLVQALARGKNEELAIERAKLLTMAGREPEAVASLQPYVRDDPRVLNVLGYTELLAGRSGDAEKHLRRAVELALDLYAPARYHLGLLARSRGETERALDEFRRAAEINGRHLEAHYQWLAAAEELGRADEAARAREAFARLYADELAASGVAEPAASAPRAVERTGEIEERPLAGASFRRTVAAGETYEVALLAPRAARARFTVEVVAGSGSGEVLLDVVHEGAPGAALWIPHRLQVPAGPAAAAPVLEFRVGPAARLARALGRAAPAGAGFSEPVRVPAPERRSADARPNILLVSLDTLRADHVGAYGAPRGATPAIDGLAAAGVVFRQAEAPSNWTLPSHYSMLSGLTPAAHGVMPDLAQVRGCQHPDRRLAVRGSDRAPLLAEVLRGQGYRTAAVTENGWVGPKFGFARGFDLYRADPRGSLPDTLAATLAELNAWGERGPWFLFVHTYATHQPYHAPRDVRLRWADARHVGFAWPAAAVPIKDYNRFRLRLFPPAPSDVRAFRDLYAGQVAWADGLVGQLVSWLDERGLGEQTVIAVTSDHGEELFERGQFDHGDTLFEEVTHVPLVLSAPARIPNGAHVDGPVALLDLPATLLDLAGAGHELGEGSSLRPAWDGARPARAVHAQAIGQRSEPLSATWDGRLKYVRRETAGGVEERLFDLVADPAERADLSAPRRADLLWLRGLQLAHAARAAKLRERFGAEPAAVDPETARRLRSLGYAR
ncbi:MAG: sulfatase-like hydrolase/transferase [Acidobacteria bacterium]|nr:sulfatase-like hydrolase/transferase [Acidobacteriota bacterium]